MAVDLAAFGMPNRCERLVVAPSPEGNYVVACLPFFSYGIQFGDLVKMREPGSVFERVLKPSGLRTLRIAFNHRSVADDRHEELHKRIIDAGLPHEWNGSGYVSVLVRHFQDQKRALSCVTDLAENGSVCWEVDPQPFTAVEAEQ